MTDAMVKDERIAALETAVAALRDATEAVVEGRLGAELDDADIAAPLYAAARLFSAKIDRVGKIAWPIETDALNATETVVLVTALLDAADVNLFDMAIWYRRAE
ncbi:hypothetical protein [Agromyces archimandritae]|uniref:Uncharacterized protein n=1 Tax=Agromyces archimandritae TaxID=2781962 RepID=A0A975FNS5_9MICO|nr:hypothetical protein [Agromyces archimandritae]QTX04411.1 hypothetical protein G127AT_14230 [Agromyces archimandritae]